MSTVRVDMRLPADLLAAVDERRGDVPRTKFVVRALEAALFEPSPEAVRQGTAQQRAANSSLLGGKLPPNRADAFRGRG